MSAGVAMPSLDALTLSPRTGSSRHDTSGTPIAGEVQRSAHFSVGATSNEHAGGHYATPSQRTEAVREIAPHFEHRLFVSATPHSGYTESFTALLALLDPPALRPADPAKTRHPRLDGRPAPEEGHPEARRRSTLSCECGGRPDPNAHEILISMREISATEAARNFSELLDAIEHHGEHFTIVRHGKAIAELEPASSSRGKDAKALLRRHRPDRGWVRDLREVRDLLETDVTR